MPDRRPNHRHHRRRHYAEKAVISTASIFVPGAGSIMAMEKSDGDKTV
jgi:hypothetical protein